MYVFLIYKTKQNKKIVLKISFMVSICFLFCDIANIMRLYF